MKCNLYKPKQTGQLTVATSFHHQLKAKYSTTGVFRTQLLTEISYFSYTININQPQNYHF